jgi:hypothetical protein
MSGAFCRRHGGGPVSATGRGKFRHRTGPSVCICDVSETGSAVRRIAETRWGRLCKTLVTA